MIQMSVLKVGMIVLRNLPRGSGVLVGVIRLLVSRFRSIADQDIVSASV